jgi:hypothetical protein
MKVATRTELCILFYVLIILCDEQLFKNTIKIYLYFI